MLPLPLLAELAVAKPHSFEQLNKRDSKAEKDLKFAENAGSILHAFFDRDCLPLSLRGFE